MVPKANPPQIFWKGGGLTPKQQASLEKKRMQSRARQQKKRDEAKK